MLKTKHEIEAWLNKMYIKRFTINDDLSVDVEGYVDLYQQGLSTIAVQFRRVCGNFNCGGNQLTSLQGVPKSIGGYFTCSSNQLISISGCPQIIDGYFYCNDNQLKSLQVKDLPLEIKGGFRFEQKLRLLELESLYDSENLVKCDFSSLKKALNAYENYQSLNLSLRSDKIAKTVKI